MTLPLFGRLAALTGVALLLWLFVVNHAPDKNISPDFIQFWAAGQLLASGQSPYDAQRQAQIQQGLGWETATQGLGRYEFLPYYYPPWLGLLFVPLVPLGFHLAKLVWLFLNIVCVLLSAYLLRNAVEGVPRSIALGVVPFFALSALSALMGQLAPLILLLLAVSWRLLATRHDRTAGAVLAWLTIKPQLTAVLLLGLLVWATRRGRWGVIQGFAGTLVFLSLASLLVVPSWLFDMLNAPREIPLVTNAFPWKGTTWFLLLKTMELPNWMVWVGYAGVALAFVAMVLRAAMDRDRSLADVFALGLLAAFFVAPYARPYDFPVLLVPMLVLLGTRLPERVGAVVLVVVILMPYANLYGLRQPYAQWDGHAVELSFFWLPLLLAVLWFSSGWKTWVTQTTSGLRSDMR